MSKEYNSFFILHPNTPDDLVKALSFAMPNTKIYNCKIIESGHPYYLHIEMQINENPALGGTLLIPHQFVLLAGSNWQDKTLGFVPSTN
jgi:hypothetical protein